MISQGYSMVTSQMRVRLYSKPSLLLLNYGVKPRLVDHETVIKIIEK